MTLLLDKLESSPVDSMADNLGMYGLSDHPKNEQDALQLTQLIQTTDIVISDCSRLASSFGKKIRGLKYISYASFAPELHQYRCGLLPNKH